MKYILYIALLSLSFPALADTIPKKQKSLMVQFSKLNEICLSDDADKPEIASACDKRDVIQNELKANGWCFGPFNMPFVLREWMTCKKADSRESVRIFTFDQGKKYLTGDIVEPRNVNERLYLDKPCKLPIVGSNRMHYYYQWAGRMSRIGCWYPTLDDGYVVIYQDGSVNEQPMLEILPHASLNSDGTATITEPDYDSGTIVKKVIDARTLKQLELRRKGIY